MWYTYYFVLISANRCKKSTIYVAVGTYEYFLQVVLPPRKNKKGNSMQVGISNPKRRHCLLYLNNATRRALARDNNGKRCSFSFPRLNLNSRIEMVASNWKVAQDFARRPPLSASSGFHGRGRSRPLIFAVSLPLPSAHSGFFGRDNGLGDCGIL